jgi:exonuclease SbcD
MRILHTSDWHLGADYFQRSRFEEQKAFLKWLLETIEAQKVDVLVVAGDVFDTPQPPAEAQQLYYRFLADLSKIGGIDGSPGRTAVIVGGNHDSPSRLDAPREVLSALSAHVVGGYLAERHGELSDPAGALVPVGRGRDVGLVIAAVPYLSEWRLGATSGFDLPAAAQQQAIRQAFGDLYTRLADKAAVRFPGVPLVATGHLTCLPKAGDKPNNEDAIPMEINRVGTIGALGPDIFDPRFAYVALGHIHRSFAVDPDKRVWYSGTPLQVSANEPADSRNALLVEIADGKARVERLSVPVTRRIVSFSGPVDDVKRKLSSLTWKDRELPPYVIVEALLESPDPGVHDALKKALSRETGKSAELVDIRTKIRTSATASSPKELPTADEITPEAAFIFAWRNRHGNVPIPDGVLSRFRSLLATESDHQRGAS